MDYKDHDGDYKDHDIDYKDDDDKTFASLGLLDPLLKALEGLGHGTPTPIQAQAIPPALKGRDLLAAAQTGTGKTAGFALPLLQRLTLEGPQVAANSVRALVLVPTRELAEQVHASVRDYGQHLPLRTAVAYGGVSINPQMMKLRKGVDILVATPGRLLDLYRQNAVKFAQLQALVLDEADRMLDLGFARELDELFAALPRKRQTLLFSATFSDAIRTLARELLRDPLSIEVSPRNTAAKSVRQWLVPVDKKRKAELFCHLLQANRWRQALVFAKTRKSVEELVGLLQRQGIAADSIHGDKPQPARLRALQRFKAGEVDLLVATDVAARGLDIEEMPLVVNFDLPIVAEDYVHRIGRTGRAGASGQAVSLVCADEVELLAAIETLIGQTLQRREEPDFEPEHVQPEVAQPEPREAPQKQPRRDKERRSSRERKPKDAQASNPDSNVATAQDGTEKPAGKRRRRGGKNKENREAGQAQQPRQSREARPAKPNRPPEVDGNRDPEEFLDDDFDNFGNRADYVSPYQGQENKGRGRRGGQQKPQGGTGQQGRGQGQGQARGKSQGAAQGGARGQGAGQGKAKKPRAGKPRGQGRENASRMSDAPLREPSEYGTGKQPSRQPVVINKRDLVRMDRFPTAEQLDELEPRRKGERPALLTRNR